MDNWLEVRCTNDVPVEFECAGERPLDLWKKFLSSLDRMRLPQAQGSSAEIREPQELVCKILWRAYCVCGTSDPWEMYEAIDLVLEGLRADDVLDFQQTIRLYEPSELPEPLSFWVRVESLYDPEPIGLLEGGVGYPPVLMDPAQRAEVASCYAGCEAEELPSAQPGGFWE